jgi:hypothetical protein
LNVLKFYSRRKDTKFWTEYTDLIQNNNNNNNKNLKGDSQTYKYTYGPVPSNDIGGMEPQTAG